MPGLPSSSPCTGSTAIRPAVLVTEALLGRIITSVRRDLPSGTVTLLFTDIEGSTKLLASIRRQLGEGAVAEAWEEGRKLTVDESVAIAVDSVA
jgi:class 3 adenylate cyclase